MNKVVSLFTVIVLLFGFSGVSFAAEPEKSDQKPAVMTVVEVNINDASAAALADSLHRVGPKTAQAIVNWRTSNGEFTSKEQLLEVKGIGEVILQSNIDRIIL